MDTNRGGKKNMNQVDEVIQKLKSMDLSKVSDDEVINEIRKIGKIALFRIKIPKGHLVNRSRCSDEFINWSYEKDISYIRDKAKIPDYNRGSFKGESIFYGCIPIDKDEHYCQLLSIQEVSKLFNIESETTLEEYAIMGKWRVTGDFTIGAIAHHQDFLKKNTDLKNMHDEFIEFMKKYPERKKDFLKISEYLSYEFAKKVSDKTRCEYKISAAFTKIMLELGVKGVLYPSAKDEGKGFNITLSPSAVDKYLKLEKVAVWRIKKRNKEEFIQPYLFCNSFQSDGRFIWVDPGKNAPPWFVE